MRPSLAIYCLVTWSKSAFSSFHVPTQCAWHIWTFRAIQSPVLTASWESQATQDTSDLLIQPLVTFDVRNKKACYITVAPTQTLSPASMFTSTSIIQPLVTFDVRNKKACYITVAPTQTLSPASMFTSTSISDGHPQCKRTLPTSVTPTLIEPHCPPVPPTTTFYFIVQCAQVFNGQRELCVQYTDTHMAEWDRFL